MSKKAKKASKERYAVTLVPHTHWDRAWYVPFEEFRRRLVRLTDRLLHILTTDDEFTCFVLDGQTVVLEDYLQIRPQREKVLKELVKKNRLYVGPWYVLPDEFIVSGEAMIRNLMIGHAMSNQFGRTMKVGYLPDPFGHIGQMPQMLAGFGIDNAIFTRGIDKDTTKLRTEFLWFGPDGTAVLALWQRNSYANAAWLGYRGIPNGEPFDEQLAIEKIGTAAENLKPHTLTGCLLLNNGVDHEEPEPRLPDLVRIANDTFPELQIEIGSFEHHVAKVRSRLESGKAQRVKGELIYKYGDMLHGVYSARMYLKQLNTRCETLLEKYAEPLSAIAWSACGMEYPDDLLSYAWKTLLKNHPHDDICGCSADTVHREMMNRFDTVLQVGELTVTDALRAIGNRVRRGKGEGAPFILFNPLPWERTELVRGTIALDKAKEDWPSFVLRDEAGQEIPYTVVKKGDRRETEVLRGRDVRQFEIQFTAHDLPALGYRTLFITEGKPSRPDKPGFKASTSRFENEFYRLEIADDGTLRLRDKTNRVTYRNMLKFEDVADAGDEYNFSPVRGTRTITSEGVKARVGIQTRGPGFVTYLLRLQMKVPKNLLSDRKKRSSAMVTLQIESAITCRADSARIDVVTRVANMAKDHRLRILFPTTIDTTAVDVDEHFDVVRRSVKLPPRKEGLRPYPTQHQKSFVDLSDGRRGLAILNRGLPEFEVVHGKGRNTIALTLLRCVGWLSRGDLLTRKGNAGPEIEAPEAQCLGTYAFEYSILPHAGNWLKGRVRQEAHALNAPLQLGRADISPSCLAPTPSRRAARRGFEVRPKANLPPGLSFIKVRPDHIVLSAFKKGRGRRGLVARVYNPATRTVQVRLQMYKPIKRANLLDLNEDVKTWLAVTSAGALEFPCSPKEIVTVELFC
jgi:mannosylglycerate hydrolase